MIDRGSASRGGSADEEIVIEEQHLDRVLSGALPCAVCAYELRGLSIRGLCPECGTPVRATILFRVDPRAKEFRPLVSRRLTANAIILWSAGGLLAVIGLWFNHLFAYLRAEMGVPIRPGIADALAAAGVIASWLGSLGIIHPIKGGATHKTIAAAAGAAAYAFFLFAIWQIAAHDRVSILPYIDASPDGKRVALRALSGVALIAIILGLRPSVRELVERCLVLRTGRVARQTLLAIAGAAAVGLVGDALHALSLAAYDGRDPTIFSNVGTLLIALSGAFILAGMVHAQFDTWQIRKSILAPSPSLEDLIDDGTPGHS